MVLCRFRRSKNDEYQHLNTASNNISSSRLEILDSREFSDLCQHKNKSDNFYRGKESQLTVGPFDHLIYMQVNTKNRTGYGRPILVHFFASIEDEHRIIYDFNSLGDDIALISSGNYERYCLK